MTLPAASPPVFYGCPVVCASAGAELDARPRRGAAAIGLLPTAPRAEDVAGALLLALGGQLTAEARVAAPVALVSARLSAHRAEDFFAQCRDTGRRLRPLASVRMETALMVQPFADRSDWSGSAYAIVTPGPRGADSAVRWAGAGVAAGIFPAAYVCEVLPYGPDQGGVLAAGVVVARHPDVIASRPAVTVGTGRVGLHPRPYLLDVLPGAEVSPSQRGRAK
jgi:hypothetical protein